MLLRLRPSRNGGLSVIRKCAISWLRLSVVEIRRTIRLSVVIQRGGFGNHRQMYRTKRAAPNRFRKPQTGFPKSKGLLPIGSGSHRQVSPNQKGCSQSVQEATDEYPEPKGLLPISSQVHPTCSHEVLTLKSSSPRPSGCCAWPVHATKAAPLALSDFRSRVLCGED